MINMKKITSIGIVPILTLGICSCSGTQSGRIESSIPEPEIIEPQEESDNAVKEEASIGVETRYARGKRIDTQSFDVVLQPLGEVTFSSYEPDTSENPLADAVFLIEKDGAALQELAGVSEDNCRANQHFLQVDAVSFTDYNNDGCDDIILICSYDFASGPDAGMGYSEVRYYSGSESGIFSYMAQMSADASSALSEITIQAAKDFIGAEQSRTGNNDTAGNGSGSNAQLEPWQEAYIDYLRQGSVLNYVLIYIDNDDIPELIEIGDCAAAGCRVMNFYAGGLHETGVLRETQLNRLYFSYIERGNLLCNSEGNMDCYYDRVYSIIDGQLVLIADGEYGAEDNSNVQFDEEGSPIYKYEWNGVEMSEADYAQELNKVYDTTRAKDGYGWNEWYSADEMISIIEKYTAE